jgi:BlaI family transcriptional regulator, penicillinase repressor
VSESHQLGALQLSIMRVLWRAGEATVARVHEDLLAELEHEEPRALTTIATMLQKMEKKGIVAHRAEGRTFVYYPTVTEAAVQRSMVSDLMENLFAGDATALVSHLLVEGEIDARELRALKDLIARREHAAKEVRRDS